MSAELIRLVERYEELESEKQDVARIRTTWPTMRHW